MKFGFQAGIWGRRANILSGTSFLILPWQRKLVDDRAEQQWIRKAYAGDRQAFAALVERYWPPIYHWLFKMTHNSHAAEDLTQDVFLKAWSAMSSFEGTGGFRPW